MKIAIIGAGLMGRAALYDVCQNDHVEKAGIFDIDENLAKQIAVQYGNNKAEAALLDASDEQAVYNVLKDYDSAVSCVTYKYNPLITKAAIQAKCNLVDLGGNNDVVRIQLEMHDEAEKAGVTIIPDCGLAPGMVSVLTADGVSKLDETKSVKIRVGGLPQSPRPPLNYQMVFSAEGLINEYWEPCLILKDGIKKTVEPMTALEELEFDGIGELEAFYTSGGTSTLPETYLNKIDFLDYKTIRYPGHCAMFRPMLEIGLASRQPVKAGSVEVDPRTVLKTVLDKNLSFNDLDLVLVRVTIEGIRDGAEKTIKYEIIDRQQSKTALTAMMRTTSFPATIIAMMAASGQIEKKGCLPQEVAVSPKIFIPQLKKRNINLTITES